MRSATYTRPRPPWIAALSWNSFTSICQHVRSASDYQRHGFAGMDQRVHSTQPRDIRGTAANPRYVLSLAILEVLNALYRVHREGHLTEAERDTVIATFYDDITNGRLWSTVCATITSSRVSRFFRHCKR